MKRNEEKIREEIERSIPFTMVIASGDRVKVRGRDFIFLPPLTNEDGNSLEDADRSDFFQVWGNGRNYRWIAFESILIIERTAPI